MSEHVHIAIIGAGFSGIGAGARLQAAGFEDFVILERAESVGGVWRDNRYPNCACDIESPLYSFSFAPNPNWSRMFSPAAEIHAYLQDCVARFGLGPHLRLGCALEAASWDEAQRCWRLETAGGPLRANVLIAGMGALSEPSFPNIPGRERFEGPSFHTSRWDAEAELDGRRVGVIGTGASAIQTVPGLQPRVGELCLFQRTAPWVLPRFDRAFSERERELFARFPALQRALRALIYLRHEAYILGFRNPVVMRAAQRVALRWLEREVSDPQLREALRPSFTIGCKRVLLSDDYYAAVAAPNVSLISAGVREVLPEGVIDSEGRHHQLDALVWATGFVVARPPYASYVRGRGGESLAERWGGSPRAHLGTMVAGFPNLFLLIGPNTGLGHSSQILMLESQLELVTAALRELDASGTGSRSLEPRTQAQARFNEEVARGAAGTVWLSGGCSSWYLDETGYNSTLWPWSTYRFSRRARFEPDDYELR